ncbi:SAM-dependent methyltransferase [Amycolatopsis sp. NPDC059021]|uniref:SAM-dependent methyltransferase n=1 Tax=Amycolatopsis sp. NPDC059021 TaxID=3346704 RepID=UPI00366D1A24
MIARKIIGCGSGVGMTENRQWDIVTSVGLTALAVASARAVETASGYIDDPYAASFVRAAKPPVPLPLEPRDDSHVSDWASMAGYLGVRTRFFDGYFAAADTPQVVILAAGLDTRAYRLDWTGRDVFEIDQPRVLEFKQQVLDAQGAVPACRRHAVAVDLRDDWTRALLGAGFQPGRPTAWLAEGLLPYLPPEAEEKLFGEIVKLSAPGSHVATERLPESAFPDSLDAPFRQASLDMGIDIETLWNRAPRRNPNEWLGAQGWAVDVEQASEVFARFGRELYPGTESFLGKAQLVKAHLPG